VMMRNQVTIRLAAIAVLICCVHGLSLAQTLDRPTTPTSQSAAKRQGFFDYALGKINPHGIDYGASMEGLSATRAVPVRPTTGRRLRHRIGFAVPFMLTTVTSAGLLR
jgi:hypothetical protein